MIDFKQFYYLQEVTDSNRNRSDIINAYGLSDLTPEQAKDRASELIKLWNMYSRYIDKTEDYGFPRNIPGLNPADIFSWAIVSKKMNWPHPEAIQNLEAMITNLKRVKHNKETRAKQEQDYTVVYQNDQVTVYQPHSEGASCRLGAGTKWCTASTKGTNHFNNYTKQQGVKLFYIITKAKQHNTATAVWPPRPAGATWRNPRDGAFVNQQKIAIAEYPDGNREVFDEEDRPMQDEEFAAIVDEYNIDTTGWLKEYSVIEQLHKACMRLSELADTGGVAGVQLNEAQETILYLIQDMRKDNYKDYAKFREETGQPDQVFLEVSEKTGLTQDTIHFYLNNQSNYGDHTSSAMLRKHNKTFQYLLVDAIQERTELAIRGYGRREGGGTEQKEWDRLNNTLNIFREQRGFYELISYSKKWTQGNWKDMQDVVIEALEELGPMAFVDGNEGMLYYGILRFCVTELPDNRFPKLEHIAIGHMQDAAKKMGLVHPHDLQLGSPGDNEQMEQWTIDMRKAGWIDFAQRYNLSVAGAKGSNDKVNYIPNSISSYENLHDYPMR